MRTTLTLDDDVAVRVQEEQRHRGTSFRDTVNALLRAGLDAPTTRRRPRQPFRTAGFDLGPSRIGSLDNVEDVLARAEGEDHR
jgi:Arc/MetJ family transcription regulator